MKIKIIKLLEEIDKFFTDFKEIGQFYTSSIELDTYCDKALCGDQIEEKINVFQKRIADILNRPNESNPVETIKNIVKNNEFEIEEKSLIAKRLTEQWELEDRMREVDPDCSLTYCEMIMSLIKLEKEKN